MSNLHHNARIANECPTPIGRLFGENHFFPSSQSVPATRSAVGQARNDRPQAAYATRRFTHPDRMEVLLAITNQDIEQCPAWLVLAFERSSFIDGDELRR
jgi:hypothetical protein